MIRGRHEAPPPWRRRWLIALAITLAFETALGGVALVRRDSRTDDPQTSQARARASVQREADEYQRERRERADAVRAVLDRRAGAIRHRDRVAFLAGIDPAAAEFRSRQAKLFDNLAPVPLGEWRYELDAERETAPNSPYLIKYGDAELWVPQVRLRYALRGFDPQPTLLEQHLTFIHRDDTWYIANDDDFPDVGGLQTAREVWDFGRVDVVSGRTALVMGGVGRRAVLQQIAAIADRAVPRVTAVWGSADWNQRVVIVVPRTTQELATIISEGNDLSQIAAVAIAQLGDFGAGYRPVGNRILVNPTNFDGLSLLGRRVVLQHEITHVATRAASGPAMPTWLVEGFADYVGYLGIDVSVRSAARELRAEVRRGRIPATLPRDDEFGGTNPRLAQVYEASWLACRLIVQQTSQEKLVAFYRAVAEGRGTTDTVMADAFRTVLNTTPDSFTRAWRAYLQQQLA